MTQSLLTHTHTHSIGKGAQRRKLFSVLEDDAFLAFQCHVAFPVFPGAALRCGLPCLVSVWYGLVLGRYGSKLLEIIFQMFPHLPARLPG